MNSKREIFRALRNSVKLNWHNRKNPLREKPLVKRRIAFVSAAALGSAALAINTSHAQIIDEDSTKALGAIYKFEEDQLPLVYDVPKIEAFWKKRGFEVFRRTIEIISVLGPYLFKLGVFEYLIRQKIRDHEGLQKKYAIKLREILTDLGPCFIKFGQAISIRPDLLPSAFLFELQKLCDSVPSFPTTEAIAVIESELGTGAVQSLFEDLNSSTPPVAAASLGQVYKLRLKRSARNINKVSNQSSWCRCQKHCQCEDDTTVAVKVQRPDMLWFVLRDLYIMRKFAKGIEKLRTTFTYNRPYDVQLLDTFASASLKELDYINEAANQEEFRKEFMHRMGSKVYIPAVHDQWTTRKVLVTEWIEGEKLAESSNDVINTLTPVGVECFLAQLLDTGRFHADPHPGNLLVTKTGRLALIDFGKSLGF